jgi:hypothetical protein
VGPQKQAFSAAATGSASSAKSLSVVNDAARNQAVYVNQAGTRIDVQTGQGPDGPAVRCTFASGFASIQQTGDPDSLPVKVLVIGQRDDGAGGVWEILSDDSIHLVQNDQTGAKGILAPAQAQFPKGMDIGFGWVYHATAVSEDGKIIVGYAENAKGFTFGRFSIPAGTTVGVYWKVHRSPDGKHSQVSCPFVIGILQTSDTPSGSQPHSAIAFPNFFAQLKIFFLGEFQSYLIMATAVHYDQANNDYVVTGTDQDGAAATATISKNGNIVIASSVAAPPAVPTFTLASPTTTTSSFVQISSTTGATIYYTVALNGATPAAPTTSSEIYNGSNADLYVYGNVNVAVSAFATMNSQNSTVATQTFQAASITPFSIAAASTGVSFSLNGNSYVINLATPQQINFTPASGWWCVYPSSAPSPVTIAETSSYFVIPQPDWNNYYTVVFMNASTPAAATIYFQVSNVYVPKT